MKCMQGTFQEKSEAQTESEATLENLLQRSLLNHIDVYEAEGKGKNKTQRIVIHYRFIGVIEKPVKEENIVLEARQGVAVEYLTA